MSTVTDRSLFETSPLPVVAASPGMQRPRAIVASGNIPAMDVVTLYRVSTDEQGESGLGLEAQEYSCGDWCAQNGTAPRAVFQEVISGKTPFSDREKLMDAVNELRKGSILLVAKLDRLSRGDAYEMAMIERIITKKGARIVSAAGEGTSDDSPASVFMRRMMGALAEYERMLIGLRTKAAMAAKKRRGEYAGGRVPFGYELSEDRLTFVENAREQRTLQRLYDLRDGGGKGSSCLGIANRLNQTGQKTRSGKPWTGNTVRAILDYRAKLSGQLVG